MNKKKCNFCEEFKKLPIEEKIEVWKYKKWCEENPKEEKDYEPNQHLPKTTNHPVQHRTIN